MMLSPALLRSAHARAERALRALAHYSASRHMRQRCARLRDARLRRAMMAMMPCCLMMITRALLPAAHCVVFRHAITRAVVTMPRRC